MEMNMIENYFNEDTYRSVEKSPYLLSLIESNQKNAFAYMANKYFNQSIPLDNCSANLLKKLIVDNYPVDKMQFYSSSAALDNFYTAYDRANQEDRVKIVKYAKPFFEKYLDDINSYPKNNSLINAILDNSDKNLLLKYIYAQQNSMSSQIKVLEKEKIHIPLGNLKNGAPSTIGNSLASQASLKKAIELNLFEKPSKKLLQWFKVIQEQNIIARIYGENGGDWKQQTPYYLKDMCIEVEKKISASGESSVRYYNEYSSLPKDFNLQKSIASFLVKYSFQNLFGDISFLGSLAKKFLEVDSINLTLEDQDKNLSFIQKHLGAGTKPNKLLVMELSNLMTKKEYLDKKEFFADVRKISTLFSYVSNIYDNASASPKSEDELIEDVEFFVSEVLAKNKHLITETIDAQNLCEAITQGYMGYSNIDLSSVWAIHIKELFNNGKPLVSNIILQKTKLAKNEDLTKQITLMNESGAFDKMMVGTLERIKENFENNNCSDETKINLFKEMPGILKQVFIKYPNYKLSSKLENDSSLVESYREASFIFSGDISWKDALPSLVNKAYSLCQSKTLNEEQRLMLNSVFNIQANVFVGFGSSGTKENDLAKKLLLKLFIQEKDDVLFYDTYKPLILFKHNDIALWKDSSELKAVLLTAIADTKDKEFIYSALSNKTSSPDFNLRMNDMDYSVRLNSPEQLEAFAKFDFNLNNNQRNFTYEYVVNENIVETVDNLSKVYENNRNHLDNNKFFKILDKLEYSIKESDVFNQFQNLKESNSHNAYGVFRYMGGRDLNMFTLKAINELNKIKDNDLLVASTICLLAKKKSQGFIGNSQFAISNFNLDLDDQKVMKIGEKVIFKTIYPSFSKSSIWDFRHRNETSSFEFIASLRSLNRKFFDISDKTIDSLEALANKTLFGFAQTPVDCISFMLADKKFKDDFKGEFNLVKQKHWDMLTKNENLIDAFEESVLIKVDEFDLVTQKEFMQELKEQREVMNLKKSIEANMNSSSPIVDNHLDDDTDNHFKI